MGSGIYSALSGAVAQERTLAVVANNVANANTTGYKADRVAFDQALAQGGAAADARRSDSLKYTAINRVEADQSAGGVTQTGNDLDVALQGDGFFVINTPNGERFTRNGAFTLDAEGVLRTHSGHAVMGDAGGARRPGRELSLPQNANQVLIGDDGTVSADGIEVGKFKLVRFGQPQSLEKEGLTLFRDPGGAQLGDAEGAQIIQGSLETSNVNAVSGMSELITVTRAFDALQKVIQTFREVDGKAARDLASR